MKKKKNSLSGVVVKFDKKRGYGFIRSDGFDRDFFVHIYNIDNQKKLAKGQRVNFKPQKSEKGMTAVDVIPGKKQLSPYRLYGLISLGSVILIMALLLKINLNIFIAYIVSVNITTFLLYGYDKFISTSTLLRVPERVLQGISFLGGTIGSYGGQKFFRHKTIKPSFKNRYKTVVTLHVIIVLLSGLFFVLF